MTYATPLNALISHLTAGDYQINQFFHRKAEFVYINGNYPEKIAGLSAVVNAIQATLKSQCVIFNKLGNNNSVHTFQVTQSKMIAHFVIKDGLIQQVIFHQR